jgi:hypothetical protein
MKRTTIYLEPELEVRLKMEALRRNQPMAEFVREAVEAYLAAGPVSGPPGAGAFASGLTDTASDVDAALAATDFAGAGDRGTRVKRPAGRAAPGRKTARRSS